MGAPQKQYQKLLLLYQWPTDHWSQQVFRDFLFVCLPLSNRQKSQYLMVPPRANAQRQTEQCSNSCCSLSVSITQNRSKDFRLSSSIFWDHQHNVFRQLSDRGMRPLWLTQPRKHRHAGLGTKQTKKKEWKQLDCQILSNKFNLFIHLVTQASPPTLLTGMQHCSFTKRRKKTPCLQTPAAGQSIPAAEVPVHTKRVAALLRVTETWAGSTWLSSWLKCCRLVHAASL